ncbi:protein kinase C-binding protein NELL1-like isoform X1 [Stylophora pistillata]|uniref:protein kinase C-binding protein NELL1-like isoform X1 n=1 Tax=Stylophora pistillata TaxID=50429 RepID=UPI000C050866|nr:protein kinase C-binding protein NELL1-like isoform X1 [Stylophora pistillata]
MARQQIKSHITVLLMLSLVPRHLTAQQCGTDLYSIYQMMLKGHTFKTLKIKPGTLECREACLADVRCQSYNVMVKGICELSNRTKEARPEDFVKDLERYYMKSSTRVPLGSIPELPGNSCREIKANEGEQAVSGNYWLDSTRSGKSMLARCDMKTEDINECAEGSHRCHQDATCQNTAGSYKCTCNSEYIGNGLNCEPEECSNYKTLTSARRNKSYKSSTPYICDDELDEKWYRFNGYAGTKMPTSCVTFKRCGGQRPGWLSGGHPTKADGRVSRTVYFRSVDNCKVKSKIIQVRNCGSYYVYHLSAVNHGSNCARFCGT